MAPHSSTLAWKIPWMEEPGRLQSMGSLRVGHDWATSLSLFTFMHWRRKWQPTPMFLPRESQRWRSLVGCCLWGRTESDTTEATYQQQQQQQQTAYIYCIHMSEVLCDSVQLFTSFQCCIQWYHISILAPGVAVVFIPQKSENVINSPWYTVLLFFKLKKLLRKENNSGSA